MSFGGKSSTPKTQTARPAQLFTDFGKVTGKDSRSMRLTTKYMPGQKEAMQGASQSLADVVSGMPTSTNVNEAFDNPFYGALSGLMKSDLGQQADEARRNLSQQQAARGNFNNSSGIYAQQLQEKNIGSQLTDALLKSRLGAFDAYSQNQTQNMQRGAFFQNVMSALQSMAMEPLRMYSGVAPGLNQISLANMQAQNAANASQGGGGGGMFSSLMSSMGGALPKLMAGG
jgi:hypothetical protein